MSPDRAKRPRRLRGKSLVPDPAPRSPVRIVHVEAEGERTEPDYCVALNNTFGSRGGFRVIAPYRPEGSGPLEVAERAIRVAVDAGEQYLPGADLSPSPLHQVWALFDRDQHRDVHAAFALLRRHNAEAVAKPGGVRVDIAYSNPSFDLWLLLHFQPVLSPQCGWSGWVHDKLRKYPGFSGFARDTAGSKALSQEQASQLMSFERITAAIRNARSLIKACPVSGCSVTAGHADRCDPLLRDPSTDVWRLVQGLMDLSAAENS